MATTKKVSDNVADSIGKEIQRANKAKRKGIINERIKGEMEILTKERGKKFRNVDLAAELGIDASLVTKWFKEGAEVKDHHLQAMADYFHCTKSWLDGSGNARVHEAYNSVIEKTGLTEDAIDTLIENRRLDRSRIDKYNMKVDAAKGDDVLIVEDRPIPKATIVSGIITHKKFPAVCKLLESIANDLPKDAKGHFPEYEELNDSPQIWSLRKNLEKILLDCIDDLIEE